MGSTTSPFPSFRSARSHTRTPSLSSSLSTCSSPSISPSPSLLRASASPLPEFTYSPFTSDAIRTNIRNPIPPLPFYSHQHPTSYGYASGSQPGSARSSTFSFSFAAQGQMDREMKSRLVSTEFTRNHLRAGSSAVPQYQHQRQRSSVAIPETPSTARPTFSFGRTHSYPLYGHSSTDYTPTAAHFSALSISQQRSYGHTPFPSNSSVLSSRSDGGEGMQVHEKPFWFNLPSSPVEEERDEMIRGGEAWRMDGERRESHVRTASSGRMMGEEIDVKPIISRAASVDGAPDLSTYRFPAPSRYTPTSVTRDVKPHSHAYHPYHRHTTSTAHSNAHSRTKAISHTRSVSLQLPAFPVIRSAGRAQRSIELQRSDRERVVVKKEEGVEAEVKRKFLLVGPRIARHLQMGGGVRVRDFEGNVIGCF